MMMMVILSHLFLPAPYQLGQGKLPGSMYGQLTSIISSMGSDQGLNPATINETETDLNRKREPLLLKTLTGALVHVHKKYFEALNSYQGQIRISGKSYVFVEFCLSQVIDQFALGLLHPGRRTDNYKNIKKCKRRSEEFTPDMDFWRCLVRTGGVL